jgi:hypothetical protein
LFKVSARTTLIVRSTAPRGGSVILLEAAAPRHAEA